MILQPFRIKCVLQSAWESLIVLKFRPILCPAQTPIAILKRVYAQKRIHKRRNFHEIMYFGFGIIPDNKPTDSIFGSKACLSGTENNLPCTIAESRFNSIVVGFVTALVPLVPAAVFHQSIVQAANIIFRNSNIFAVFGIQIQRVEIADNLLRVSIRKFRNIHVF